MELSMTIPNSDSVNEPLRTLWSIRNTWDSKLRGLVRELLRADLRHLHARARVKT
jgi:hypothetical protein